ncbi:hypothetical protein H8B15_04100 [Hymenobacter sp. BT507]|uniref:Uncharacterized protein n=1 Tax=Hymenobacter citatus TaxID=2763506 RepID=A0ABR7MH63_9BACT|nr:hypothetical protein [Hymenobacter citatus]MBC6610090.1 hypothetical protein [Hymenobacter citatus]
MAALLLSKKMNQVPLAPSSSFYVALAPYLSLVIHLPCVTIIHKQSAFYMKHLFILLALTLTLGSCTSATESKGVDAILAFYGGKLNYAKGVSATTEDKLQGKFYELKLTGIGEKIKQHFTSFQLPASNCAYLFYEALSSEERQNYAFIRVNIEGEKTNYEFAMQDLAKVEQAMSLVTHSVNDIRAQDYNRFLAKGNPQASSPSEWQQAKPTFIAADREYGSVKEFSLQGFEFMQQNLSSGTEQFVRMAGVLVREKNNTDFTFIVAPTASLQSQYLYGFAFEK